MIFKCFGRFACGLITNIASDKYFGAIINEIIITIQIASDDMRKLG